MRTLDDIRPTHKLSAPKSVTTKKELNFSKFPETACTIPAGTKLEVYFSETHTSRLYFEYGGSLRTLLVENAYKKITGFQKPPMEITMLKWADNGVCKTPTGKTVEPDGTSYDGSPSWLLVFGLI